MIQLTCALYSADNASAVYQADQGPKRYIIEFIQKTEPYKIQTNIHHQQSEEGTRPFEDQPLAEEIKFQSRGAKFMIKTAVT